MKIKQHPYAGLKEVTRWGVVRILQVSLSHVGSTDLLYTHFPQEKHKVKLYFGDNRGLLEAHSSCFTTQGKTMMCLFSEI